MKRHLNQSVLRFSLGIIFPLAVLIFLSASAVVANEQPKRGRGAGLCGTSRATEL